MSIVNTPRLRVLYDEAQANPEWATTRLWEHLFRHTFFTESRWVVSSQQPPTRDPDDLRRVDLVVENFQDPRDTTTVLFMEAKRASAIKDDIDTVEHQAYNAASAYCATLPRARLIWTMTCVGSAARIWIFDASSDYLTPYVPSGYGLSDITEYLDVRTHGRDLEKAVNFIKNHPTPPRQVTSAATSSQPSSGPSETRTMSVRDVAEYRGSIPLRQDLWKEVIMLGMLGKHGQSFSVQHPDGTIKKIGTTGWTVQLLMEGEYMVECFAKILGDGTVIYVRESNVPK